MKYIRIAKTKNGCRDCLFGGPMYYEKCFKHYSCAYSHPQDSCMDYEVWRYIFIKPKELPKNIKTL